MPELIESGFKLKHTEIIEYHGIINFYGSVDRKTWVEGYAKFTDGLLVNIRFEEKEL